MKIKFKPEFQMLFVLSFVLLQQLIMAKIDKSIENEREISCLLTFEVIKNPLIEYLSNFTLDAWLKTVLQWSLNGYFLISCKSYVSIVYLSQCNAVQTRSISNTQKANYFEICVAYLQHSIKNNDDVSI